MSGFRLITKGSKVIRDGKHQLTFDDNKKVASQIAFVAEGAPLKIVITDYDEQKEQESIRSIQQNKYYHKILDILCDYTGDTHMSMHDELKVRFLARPYVLKDKEYMIVESTTGLKIKDFSAYLEKIFHWAAEELGVTLPSASDYY